MLQQHMYLPAPIKGESPMRPGGLFVMPPVLVAAATCPPYITTQPTVPVLPGCHLLMLSSTLVPVELVELCLVNEFTFVGSEASSLSREPVRGVFDGLADLLLVLGLGLMSRS